MAVASAVALGGGQEVKDGKIAVAGTATSISVYDYDDMLLAAQVGAALGVSGLPESRDFNLKGTDGLQYTCRMPSWAYPQELEIGDTVEIIGKASHTEENGIRSYKVNGCKLLKRKPGPAKHVVLEGIIIEHKQYPGDEIKRPSDWFTVKADGRVYGCHIKHGGAQFKEYSQDDKIAISGVLNTPQSDTVDRCKVESRVAAHKEQ
jgi:hypothetical protein